VYQTSLGVEIPHSAMRPLGNLSREISAVNGTWDICVKLRSKAEFEEVTSICFDSSIFLPLLEACFYSSTLKF
jgi:hypothetical protein